MSSMERFKAWFTKTWPKEALDEAPWAGDMWTAWRGRDAEVERLVEALRETRNPLEYVGAGDDLIERIDALLREYDGEKRDE